MLAEERNLKNALWHLSIFCKHSRLMYIHTVTTKKVLNVMAAGYLTNANLLDFTKRPIFRKY